MRGLRGKVEWALCALISATFCGNAVAAERAELSRIVDSPTAGLVGKGYYAVGLRLFAGGGVLGQVQAGALKRLTIGLSFGGREIIGRGAIDWNPRVEVAARYRVIEESATWPALVLGYETQGYGTYARARYENKSKGFFVAMSKNFTSSLGQFGVHAGANKSRETVGGEDVSGWVGVDKSLNEDLSLLGEYELARNDGSESVGYLNAGARWAVAPQLKVSLLFKNLLQRGLGEPEPSRELTVFYTEEF
ncbi:MAG: hypothetical protein ACPHSD_18145 [Candidatus Latescibacterota bacterium]